MPWRTKSVKEQREDFVKRVNELGNISQACRDFEITRRTGYKWLARIANEEKLEDKSRRPHRVANKTDDETERVILSVRKNNPSWGGRKIYDYLVKKGIKSLPSPRTCDNVLSRNGFIKPEESQKHKPYKRFAREHCNELWQTDFKGDFLLQDGSRCYPLTILDDCSRYSIMIDCKPDTLGVIDSFKIAFYNYGLPESILSDNGCQFAGFKGGYTSFEKWLMEHDVLPIHGRVYHPQTQGKIERFHRTMKSEFLKDRQFKNIDDINEQMAAWRIIYNEERPHLALCSKSPAEIYVPSKREYSEKIPEYQYDGSVIKVNSWGYIRFANWQIYLSETMSKTIVEIAPDTTEDTFNIYFRNFKIAEIDARVGKLKNRKIYRRK